MHEAPRHSARSLGNAFGCLAGLTYLLIVLGALVRANGAGLACPDWPLCFGELVPPFDVKVGFEWGHRALAGSLSVGLLLLSLAGWRRRELRGWLRPRLAVAWALLAIQVVFGGLTVLLLLAPWTVTAHLLLGNSFCATLVWIALDLRERDLPPQRAAVEPGVRPLMLTVAVLLVAQMLLGGLVSSHMAGLACADFPTCDGRNALALLAGLAALAWLTRRSARLGRLARASVYIALLQIAVGVLNVMLRLPVEVTGLHSALAAALVLVGLRLVREVVLAQATSRSLAPLGRAVEAR
jgi:cytochrome c oxidase assembly protein subunit 15